MKKADFYLRITLNYRQKFSKFKNYFNIIGDPLEIYKFKKECFAKFYFVNDFDIYIFWFHSA